MWTADSIDITADQLCWTADGYNGCDGFDWTGGGSDENKYQSNEYTLDRKMSDDAEILEFINIILTKGLL